MITNLSNHPSAGWPKDQWDYASEKWGGIRDLPMPPVKAEASPEEVLARWGESALDWE